MIAEKVGIVRKRVFGIFTLELREDGILHRHVSENGEYRVGAIRDLNSVIGEMVNHRPVPVLITSDDFVVYPSETSSYRANKSSSPYSKAEAVIARTPAHQLMTAFYLKANPPQRPTKMFENEEDAVDWLKTFL